MSFVSSKSISGLNCTTGHMAYVKIVFALAMGVMMYPCRRLIYLYQYSEYSTSTTRYSMLWYNSCVVGLHEKQANTPSNLFWIQEFYFCCRPTGFLQGLFWNQKHGLFKIVFRSKKHVFINGNKCNNHLWRKLHILKKIRPDPWIRMTLWHSYMGVIPINWVIHNSI